MKTIIWKGIVNDSLEYLNLIRQGDTFTVESKTIGASKDKIFSVDYYLKINADWTIETFDVTYEVNRTKERIFGKRNADVWVINGLKDSNFAHVKFIDISITPFTNSLPIKNLHLGIGQQQQIGVIYIDILASEIKAVQQKYTRLEERVYKYENIPNDFEANISIDGFGLVEFYPLLFEKTHEI